MGSVHGIVGGCSPDVPGSNSSTQSAPVTATAPSQPRQEGKLVLAFGDSLYAGYGLAPQESFPAQLEEALRQRGIATSVHNAGVSGDTTAAGLQRLNFTLDGLRRKPDLAVVGLGANDMLRGLQPAATEANLLAICNELRKRGIRVVLTGMLAAPNLGQDYGRRFNGLFQNVAEQCGATLYPFFLEGVFTKDALMLPDDVHPNSSGIRRVVSNIEPVVARELSS
ncbi:MAG: arylesterase [Sphingomonas sp.]|nr:arylesterase [Sphingomonas sp.]